MLYCLKISSPAFLYYWVFHVKYSEVKYTKASSFVSNFAIWIADIFMYIMNCPNNYIYYCIFNMKV